MQTPATKARRLCCGGHGSLLTGTNGARSTATTCKTALLASEIPPDAQVEIDKRDERIAELEIRLSGFSDLTGLMQSSLEGDTSRISELLEQNEKQATEIARLKGVIAKCEAAIDSHLNPCGCFNGCEFCSGKESLEEALASIKEIDHATD